MNIKYLLVLSLFSCGKQQKEPSDNPIIDYYANMQLSGGETSITNRTSNAFTLPAPNLDQKSLEQHFAGDLDFDRVFVAAPAEINQGLGPFFNNTSCSGCHVGNGRGLPILGQTNQRSHMLVRVSLNNLEKINTSPHGAPVPVPHLGGQLQDHVTGDHKAEVFIELKWEMIEGKYKDGTPYQLRKPILAIKDSDGNPLNKDILTSLRMSPPVFGAGLLEAVEEKTLIDIANNQKKSNTEITGKLNYVWDPAEQKVLLGKFGMKGNTATLLTQTAAAFFNDMGINNKFFYDDSTKKEISDESLKNVAVYTQTLAVPKRDNKISDSAKKGSHLFEAIQCSTCHVPSLKTGKHQIAALSDQEIHPFTDLLLHDMGEELADHRPDFLASGQEWKTPALWGIGLTHTVLPGAGFMHDGRARSFEEAILWHGGEAQKSKEKFSNLSKSERHQLVDFLYTL